MMVRPRIPSGDGGACRGRAPATPRPPGAQGQSDSRRVADHESVVLLTGLAAQWPTLELAK